MAVAGTDTTTCADGGGGWGAGILGTASMGTTRGLVPEGGGCVDAAAGGGVVDVPADPSGTPGATTAVCWIGMSGEISVGGVPPPRFWPVPTYIGLRSAAVSSCERKMCGVTIMTMSVCVRFRLPLPKMLRRIGMLESPGKLV